VRVEYHPETVLELKEATRFYENQRHGLGDEFREEIYHTIDKIVADPFLHRPVKGQIRRCFVHRFPFSIFYRIIGKEVLRILVIKHHRQHPARGLNRR